VTAAGLLSWAATAAAVLVVGYAVLYGLGLARRGSTLRYLGLAYLVGWGVLGALLSFALMAGLELRTGLVAVVVALVAVAGVAAARVAPVVPEVVRASSGGQLGRIAAAVGAAVIVIASAAALVAVLRPAWAPEEDAIYIWLPHAAAIFYAHGLWDAVIYHAEYPPLVATMQALSLRFAHGFHPALLPFGQTVLGLSFVGGVLALLDRFVPRWLAFPSIALLVVAPKFFTRLDSLLADQTLAYFVAIAAVACVLWLRERRTAWLVLAVLMSTAGTLTKWEGASYALLLALIVVAAAAIRRGRRVAATACLLFVGVAAIEPWRLWLGDHGAPTSSIDYRLSSLLHPLYLAHRLDRVPYSVQEVLKQMFSPGQWLLILPLALLTLVVVFRRVPLLAAASVVWLVVAFAGLIVVYWIGTFEGIALHDEVPFTAPRVAATIVIVAGVMTPVVLALALDRSPHRRDATHSIDRSPAEKAVSR
jgi:hypothetical protein